MKTLGMRSPESSGWSQKNDWAAERFPANFRITFVTCTLLLRAAIPRATWSEWTSKHVAVWSLSPSNQLFPNANVGSESPWMVCCRAWKNQRPNLDLKPTPDSEKHTTPCSVPAFIMEGLDLQAWPTLERVRGNFEPHWNPMLAVSGLGKALCCCSCSRVEIPMSTPKELTSFCSLAAT